MKRPFRRTNSRRICPRVEPLEARTFLTAVLDPTWGNAGIVTAGTGLSNVAPNAVLPLPDGSVIVAGNVNDNPAVVMAASGMPSDYMFLSRFNNDGSLDAHFGNDGTAIFPDLSLRDAPVQLAQNGEITLFVQKPVASKANGVASSQSADELVRITATGRLDKTYGQGGKVTIPSDWENLMVAVDDKGRAIVAGDVVARAKKDALPAVQIELLRYTAGGKLDSSFASGGIRHIHVGFADTAENLAVGSNGTIAIGAELAPLPSEVSSTSNILRFTVHGAWDRAFGNRGNVTVAAPQPTITALGSILVTDANEVIVAGGGGIAAYKPDGQVDSQFSTQGLSVLPEVSSLAMAANGGIVFSFDSTPVETMPPNFGGLSYADAGIQVLNGDGSPNTAFGVNGQAYPPRQSSQSVSSGVATLTANQGAPRVYAIVSSQGTLLNPVDQYQVVAYVG